MTARGYQALSEREKQTLRLMLRGHDAKSMARHLGLSVHTVNERLRDARRKLEVSSSREAARLVFDAEGADSEKLRDSDLGEAAAVRTLAVSSRFDAFVKMRTFFPWGIAGVVIMSVIVSAIIMVTQAQFASGVVPRPKPGPAIVLAPIEEPVRCVVASDSEMARGPAPRKVPPSGKSEASSANGPGWLSQADRPIRLRCNPLPD